MSWVGMCGDFGVIEVCVKQQKKNSTDAIVCCGGVRTS